MKHSRSATALGMVGSLDVPFHGRHGTDAVQSVKHVGLGDLRSPGVVYSSV